MTRETEIRNALGRAGDYISELAYQIAENEPELHGQVFEVCWMGTKKMKPAPTPEGETGGNWQTVDMDAPHYVMRVAFEIVAEGQRKGQLERGSFPRSRDWCGEC